MCFVSFFFSHPLLKEKAKVRLRRCPSCVPLFSNAVQSGSGRCLHLRGIMTVLGQTAACLNRVDRRVTRSRATSNAAPNQKEKKTKKKPRRSSLGRRRVAPSWMALELCRRLCGAGYGLTVRRVSVFGNTGNFNGDLQQGSIE